MKNLGMRLASMQDSTDGTPRPKTMARAAKFATLHYPP
jgi:hypothetical protein